MEREHRKKERLEEKERRKQDQERKKAAEREKKSKTKTFKLKPKKSRTSTQTGSRVSVSSTLALDSLFSQLDIKEDNGTCFKDDESDHNESNARFWVCCDRCDSLLFCLGFSSSMLLLKNIIISDYSFSFDCLV